MRLTFEQVKEITFGAVNIQKESDGIHFFKCTRAQIDAWYKVREDLGARAETTTGVTIDFHTNARKIVFSVVGSKFEVLLNGFLTQQVVGENESCEHEVCVVCSGEENRITLIFPSHGVGVLKAIELEDDAYIKPHVFDKKILFIGDSITQGWDSGFDSMSYAYLTAAHYNAECIINGIGGAVYHASAFDKPEFDPDIVIVAYGVNDFFYYQTRAEFAEQVSSYLDKLQLTYPDKKVFVVTPIWMQNEDSVTTSLGTLEENRSIIKQEAERRNFFIVDGRRLVPHFEQFYADVVHPNALGFGSYANQLIAEMNKY